MKKLYRILSIVLCTALISTFFVSCRSSNVQKNGLTKVKLNEVTRSVFYAPQYAAISKGFFKEEGLDIDIESGEGADKTMQQVISGNDDIGFCGPEQTIYLYNQGKEDHAVLFAQLTKRDGSFIVARKKASDFSFEDLKGKTVIGGRPGGVPEMTFEYILKNHGIDPKKDMKLITNIAFAAVPSAFQGGTGEYATIFEPTASMIEKNGSGYVVGSVGSAGGEVPYTCYFATKSYIQKNPGIIQKFTNALYKGQLWVDSHSSKEIAEACIKFFPGTDIDILTKVVDRYKSQDTWAKNPILSEAAISRLEDIIQSYDSTLLPKRPPYNEIVTTKYAEEAIKNIKSK